MSGNTTLTILKSVTTYCEVEQVGLGECQFQTLLKVVPRNAKVPNCPDGI